VHIAEGLLSGTVLGAGWAVTAAGTAAGLRRMTPEDVPRTATLASAFFVASLVHVPLGISSAHLILNGLMGVILGVRAFPAMLVALFLQAVLFQFGGLSTLGVTTADMALPAVLCAAAMRRWIRRASPGQSFVPGFVVGAASVALAGICTASALGLSGRDFRQAGTLIFAAHIPIMVVEGLVTGAAVVFLKRVRPELPGDAGDTSRFEKEAG